MKKIIFLIFGLLNFILLEAQELISNSSLSGICYAGAEIKRIFIPPPDKFQQKKGSLRGGSITVQYTGFSTQGQVAVEHAVSILESMLPADTRITVSAKWERIATPGVLGNSMITGFAVGGAIDALYPNVYYPVTLAEKIAGVSLNDDNESDIDLIINNSISWYLGIDGNTPATRFDLVTVVLHELCHGLGFFDSMDLNDSIGWYGVSSVPVIYDKFVENSRAEKLTDTSKYRNFSPELRAELINEELYFAGPLLNQYTSGSRARLYVPSRWDQGSSISHLEEELTNGDENSLMTPFINPGEAIHDPGNFTFSILGDIGWINTRIVHIPIEDTEENISEIELFMTVESDTLYNRDKVGVVYSYDDDFSSADTVYMGSAGTQNSYKTTIGIPSYNSELHYYFFAEDTFSRLYRSPSWYEEAPYTVYIGTDTVKPVIFHSPEEYYLETDDSIHFTAAVIDNIGIDSVYVEYRKNSGPSEFIALPLYLPGIYRTAFKPAPGFLSGGDSIQYRIFAADSAHVSNISVSPENGYFTIKIEEIKEVLTSYSTDFSGGDVDFFNRGFEVMKPSGFNRYGLQTKHPYESPGVNGQSIVYTSMLRHPLKFNESGLLISFNEIVLVEPGEPGSVFGSDDFYDYVIVEATADFGKTWHGLIDGYDSRYNKSMESAYKSSMEGDNSTFVPNESLLLNRKIFYRTTEYFSDGDTLLLRFRIYSDPLANGWGWVIDDLKINLLVDEVEKINSVPSIIYPNPGSGLFRIKTSDGFKSTRYSVFNSSGMCVKEENSEQESEIAVDLSNCPSGLYIILLYHDSNISTFRYSLIK